MTGAYRRNGAWRGPSPAKLRNFGCRSQPCTDGQGTRQFEAAVRVIGSLVYVLLPSVLVALRRTCVPAAIPGTGMASVLFAATCLRNVSLPSFTTYTFTALASLFVKFKVTAAVVRGAVSTATWRPPHAAVTINNMPARIALMSPSKRWFGTSASSATNLQVVCAMVTLGAERDQPSAVRENARYGVQRQWRNDVTSIVFRRSSAARDRICLVPSPFTR